MSSQYGELRPINGGDLLASLGHTSKFQWVSCAGFVIAASSLTGGQPNFAHVWLSLGLLHYIYIFGGLARQNFARCKIHFTSKSCVLVYWQHYCTALQQQASAKLCGAVQGMELPNFRRGCHLHLAGRPSRWTSAPHSSFRDVLPSQPLGTVLKKLNVTQQKHTYANTL